jgi:hypothetical protein
MVSKNNCKFLIFMLKIKNNSRLLLETASSKSFKGLKKMSMHVKTIAQAEKQLLSEIRKLDIFANFEEAYDYLHDNNSKLRNDLRSLDRNPHLGKDATKKKTLLTNLFTYKREYETLRASMDPSILREKDEVAFAKKLKKATQPVSASAAVSVNSVDGAIDLMKGRKEREKLNFSYQETGATALEESGVTNVAKKKVVKAKASIKSETVSEVQLKVASAPAATASSTSASASSEEIPVCCVCFDSFSKENAKVQICNSEVKEKEHPGVHEQCLRNYISSLIDNNASVSKCPQVFCLCSTHVFEKKVILPYKKWKAFASQEQLNKYQTSSEYFLYFLCGNCHRSKSQLVPYMARSTIKKLLDDFSLNNYDFDFALEAYMEGLLSPRDMFNKMEEGFPWWKAKKVDYQRVWESIKAVLVMIEDPERRAALQSYCLSQRPYFETLCCSNSQCFQCKTRAHGENPCSSVLKQLDSSVMPCPHCNVFLAKGDGCNSVVCHCGFSFNWSNELQRYKHLLKFSEMYGEQAHDSCVNILCGFLKGDSNGAEIWQEKNRKLIEKMIGVAFFARYGPYGFYGFAKNNFFKGMHNSVVTLFQGLYSKEIAKQQQSNEFATESLAQTMYPEVSDRFLAYSSLKEMKISEVTACVKENFASLSMWSKQVGNEALESMKRVFWAHNMSSFLYFFRDCDVSTAFFCYSNQVMNRTNTWDYSISNKDLEISLDGLDAKRPGNVSSYPAAFCKMSLSIINKLSIQLVEVPGNLNNCVTFGLCRIENGKPSMSISGSDGVGHNRDTIGFFESRGDSTSGNIFGYLFGTSPSKYAVWRKLKDGDILTAEYNKVTRELVMSLNYTEMSLKIDWLPDYDYCFALTIANEHKFRIIKETDASVGSSSNNSNKAFLGLSNNLALAKYVNADQCLQYQGMLQFLNYLAKTPYKKLDPAMKSIVNEYINIGKSSMDLLDSELDYIGVVKNFVNQKPLGLSSPLSLTDLVIGFCFDLVSSEKQYQNKIVKLAKEFLDLYKEDAPFVAAAICCGGQGGKASEEVVEMAVAFMMEHPKECNEWYAYNASLSESLLPELSRVPRSCTCLPRCLKNCKKA